MGAERSQWQFPANEVGKVIGWSDEASPSNPSASKGLVNKGPFVEPDDIADVLRDGDIGTTVQGWSANLDEVSAVNPGTAGKSVLGSETAQDIRDFLGLTVFVSTRTALKALSTTLITAAFLMEEGRRGLFEWDASVLVATHQADTQEGIYVAPSAVSDGAWVRQFDGPVYAEWFGALGSGGDDTTAIAGAVTVAAAHDLGPIHFGPGDFGLSTVTLPATWVNGGFIGSGSSLTKIHQEGTETQMFLGSGNALGADILLTADAALGAKTLTVGSTAGIAAGEVYNLVDTVSYNPLDASYKSGELVRIKSVDSGTQVTLYRPVSGSMDATESYTTANGSKIRKVTFVEGFVFRDIELSGDVSSTTKFFELHKYRAVRFSRNYMHDGGSSGVSMRTCMDIEVTENTIDTLIDDTANGHVGYGIALYGACDSFVVSNNIMKNCRHGFTTGGNDGNGFPHHGIISGNVCTENSLSGIDTHNAGAHILIQGNRLDGTYVGSGITIRSRYTQIRDNIVLNATGHGVSLIETGLKDIHVERNIIRFAGSHGVSCSAACIGLTVIGNDIQDCGADGITVTFAVQRVRIHSNNIARFGMSLANRTGILLTNAGAGAAHKPDIMRNVIRSDLGGSAGFGVRVLDNTGGWVHDNKAHGTFTTAAFSILAGNENINNLVLA